MSTLSLHEVIQALADPECEDAADALYLAISALNQRIRDHCTPTTWSLMAEEADLLLDRLAPASTEGVLVYWMKQYVTLGQSFANVVHRYVDPGGSALGCVVVWQVVIGDCAAVRAQILEILENSTVSEIVIACVFADQRVEASLRADFAKVINCPLTFISLCRSDARGMTGLRNRIFQRFALPDCWQALTFMPRNLIERINR
ncbi:hypothetical protein DV532_27065 (plasmid) [Pseudomonas sp. Leaf58]|uniref:hypothetical protein n=1 Tax=Pseudomonas sp. Leaf58 TaxID=1736226 RepID=UPI0006F21F42|nr:hypothetical protein [Pseudomonas sp. Leaf58]AYG47944.1 hypothetical protein DV532_27065 [Pseudomonas sp. Leaf58]KQN62493.1 hypothetical protein ASF02_10105 [Pseudomonas sp. Leaf58]